MVKSPSKSSEAEAIVKVRALRAPERSIDAEDAAERARPASPRSELEDAEDAKRLKQTTKSSEAAPKAVKPSGERRCELASTGASRGAEGAQHLEPARSAEAKEKADQRG